MLNSIVKIAFEIPYLTVTEGIVSMAAGPTGEKIRRVAEIQMDKNYHGAVHVDPV